MQEANRSRDRRYDLQIGPKMTPTLWLRAIETLIAERHNVETWPRILRRRRNSNSEQCPASQYLNENEEEARLTMEGAEIDPRVRPYENFVNSPFWRSLTRDAQKHLLSLIEISDRPTKSKLLVEGKAVADACILLDGFAKIYIGKSRNRRVLLHVLAPGEILGLDALVSDQFCKSSVETITRSAVGSLRRDELVQFLAMHPCAAQEAARQLSEACHKTLDRLRTINPLLPSQTRIERLLVEWARQGRRTAGGITVRVHLNRREIAECVATAGETVSRSLSSLQRRRLIAKHGSFLTISDSAGSVLDL